MLPSIVNAQNAFWASNRFSRFGIERQNASSIGLTGSQTRQETHGERKTIGPTKDSAIEWVSFESIEIVMALGLSGNSPYIFA